MHTFFAETAVSSASAGWYALWYIIPMLPTLWWLYEVHLHRSANLGMNCGLYDCQAARILPLCATYSITEKLNRMENQIQGSSSLGLLQKAYAWRYEPAYLPYFECSMICLQRLCNWQWALSTTFKEYRCSKISRNFVLMETTFITQTKICFAESYQSFFTGTTKWTSPWCE
jgi:hypothetical protein